MTRIMSHIGTASKVSRFRPALFAEDVKCWMLMPKTVWGMGSRLVELAYGLKESSNVRDKGELDKTLG